VNRFFMPASPLKSGLY